MTLPQVVATGNLVADPEMSITTNNTARTKIRLACNESKKVDGEWVDGEASYFDVYLWRDRAEQAAEEYKRGDRVTVVGKIRVRQWESKDGKRGTNVEIEADTIALTLKTRKQNTSNTSRSNDSDPWAF